MKSSNERDVKYTFARLKNTSHPGITSINDILPDDLEYQIFDTKNKARKALRSAVGENTSRSDYIGIFTISVSKQYEEEKIIKKENFTLLSAELSKWHANDEQYWTMENVGPCGYMVSPDGIKHILNESIKSNVCGLNNSDVRKINGDIEELLKTLDQTKLQLEDSKIEQWRRLEIHTLLLIESILKRKPSLLTKKPKSEQIISELELVREGLSSSKQVLLNPNDVNIQKLRKFVANAADGKTNYWKIWGGVLMMIAAAAILALSIIPPVGVPLAAGILGYMLLSAIGVYLSKTGHQHGVAKVMDDMVTEAVAVAGVTPQK